MLRGRWHRLCRSVLTRSPPCSLEKEKLESKILESMSHPFIVHLYKVGPRWLQHRPRPPIPAILSLPPYPCHLRLHSRTPVWSW